MINKKNSVLNRREWIAASTAAVAVSALPRIGHTAEPDKPETQAPPEDYRIQNGRIKQSVYGWCFNPMPIETLIEAAHRMGLHAMDIGSEHYPRLRELGIKIPMIGSHGFSKGPFNQANHEFCITKLKEAIETAVRCEAPNVITFTGMRESGITDEQGAQNCVDCWKQVIGLAEEKGINLCLEILNSRDDTHPMKGHPGYFGDDVERCIDLIKRVDSPRMKLLFDIYHVQVMNGDVIHRLSQYKDYIGHYHTAGVPGRGELDDTQELNYPAIMRAILETGYTGYVSQEFIPTWEDKIAALRHAVKVCDV